MSPTNRRVQFKTEEQHNLPKGVSVIITCQDEGNPTDNLSSEEYDQLVKVTLLLRLNLKMLIGCVFSR